MKYRKMLFKYNANFKKAVLHSSENIRVVIHSSENISCISGVKLDVICFLHRLPCAHFRISNACKFRISGRKHLVKCSFLQGVIEISR